jgi:phosphate transport system permease protein
MNPASADSAAPGPARSARFHRWRGRKDTLARWLIGVGGVSVILAVVLIFFYLLLVVSPLFKPASTELVQIGSRPDWAMTAPLYLAEEEQKEVAIRVAANGTIEFYRVEGAETIQTIAFFPDGQGEFLRVSEAIEHSGLLAAVSADGRVFLLRHVYETRFDGGVEQRQIIPSLEFPYGREPVIEFSGADDVVALALSETESGLLLAALDANGGIEILSASRRENLMTGEVTLDSSRYRTSLDTHPTSLAVSGNRAWLYLGDVEGRVHRLGLPGLEVAQTLDLKSGPITSMSMLLGGISLLAGSENGTVSQLFPVRDEHNQYSLELIRQFHGGAAPVRQIINEQRRKGFVVLDEHDGLAIYHSTAGRLIHAQSLAQLQPRAAALAPRADGLLIEGRDGTLYQLAIDNEHPEISFSALWRKVWYENYTEPEYVWQSSAANNEFEPKFSLTPLVFGTLKAALYAMLFAMPLALMGAAYTAYFMAPRLRQLVKPGIEIMAALPTVILGFLAGLWFAPYLEEHLAGIFALLLILPPGVLLFAWWWDHYDGPVKSLLAEGYEPMLQLPLLVLLGWFALWVAEPLQYGIFGTDLRSWLSHQAGIDYDQRNALVVGCAMGLAVIPTIFSIAEDAIFGVPRSLSNGSLALGATPWQSLVRVVIPTASPGIFSALMIGLGRAVGETMIVLMATGNTPIMDWNLFEGMRTLAANIAVEMPESEVGSSHYRILFLAALVLFLFTFVVNTGAELVRQRLRDRYSSL